MRRLTTFLLLIFMATSAIKAQVEVEPKGFSNIIDWFGDIDTAYIRPQTYNWQAMIKTVSSFDICNVDFIDKHSPIKSASLSTDPNLRIGPSFGWRFIFGGFSFDVIHNSPVNGRIKHEWEFSLYSSPLVVDLFYRRTGSDYRLRSVKMGEGITFGNINDVPFDAISLGITGFNAFYVFNHRRFSIPAAMNQSTMQKISQGSWVAGFGYTHNKLDVDYVRLNDIVMNLAPVGYQFHMKDSAQLYTGLRYNNYSLHGGYAYNYVPCRNVLLSAMGTISLGYKHAKGRSQNDIHQRFSEYYFSPDANLRLAIVYNNMRWFVTLSGIIHTANFKTSQMDASNTFGMGTLCMGVNF